MKAAPDKPIRILHLISTLNIGGAERNLAHLTTMMDRQSFRNMVVSMTDGGPMREVIARAGIPVSSLAMRKGVPDLRGILRLHKIIQAFQPDIIQAWMYHANLLGLFFTAGHSLIWNIRCSDMDLSRYGRIYRLVVRAGALLAGVPKVVITNAQAGKTVHEALGYHPRRWEIIPNGFDTELFKPDPATREKTRNELHIPHEAIAIGLIARLDPMKGHQTFFSALRILKKIYPEVHAILAGRGVEPSNPLILNLGPPLNDHIHMLGERTDIPEIMTALDILVSSSLSEGFPNTVGEAMSTSVPCVVTDTGDSCLLTGQTSLVVPRGNPQALAETIARLIEAGTATRTDLGQIGRRRIQDHYSLSAMVQRYETLYRQILPSYNK